MSTTASGAFLIEQSTACCNSCATSCGWQRNSRGSHTLLGVCPCCGVVAEERGGVIQTPARRGQAGGAGVILVDPKIKTIMRDHSAMYPSGV